MALQRIVVGVLRTSARCLRLAFLLHGLHQLLHLADGVAFLAYLAEQTQLLAQVVHSQQGAGVAHVDFLVLQRHLYLGWQFEEAQVVGDGSTVLTHSLAQIVLRNAEFVEKSLVGQRDFHRVKVGTLNVFHQRQLQHALVLHLLDVRGDGREAGKLRGTPTTLACHNLVAVGTRLSQRHRLNDAVGTDGFSQFAQRVLVEVLAGLVGVGGNLGEGYLADDRRACRRHLASCIDKGVQTTSEPCMFLCCHFVLQFLIPYF